MPSTHRRLVLLGLRGCGKSTVGVELARLLALEFRDSDAEIARAAGLSAGEVLRRHGLEEFRRRERDAVRRLAAETSGVLALGGGAPLDAENRALLAGWRAVLLDASDAVLEGRITAEATGARPPLTSLPIVEEIRALRVARWPAYLSWDPILVSNEGRTAAETAQDIVRQIA